MNHGAFSKIAKIAVASHKHEKMRPVESAVMGCSLFLCRRKCARGRCTSSGISAKQPRYKKSKLNTGVSNISINDGNADATYRDQVVVD